MVLGDLASASGRIENPLAVAGQREPRVELGDPPQGAQVVGQRIGRGPRPEPDVGRDAPQQRVTGDEHAVTQQREVTVGVARQVEHLPAADRLSGLERLGILRVVDERGQLLLLRAHRRRLFRRRPVLEQVLLRALGGLAGPRSVAVLVVEHALVHGSLREPGDDRGAHRHGRDGSG